MEAIKKQATKLRDQVARQQQAILRQLGHLGHETVEGDEAQTQYHEELQNLYKSTRSAKHFQKDIIRGVEGLISTDKKQMELARRLAEDCCKYGIENQSEMVPLSRAALDFGTSHVSMEDHRETLLGILGYQVSEPLRASIRGAPLEDARHLTHQFDKVRQEFESQAVDVIRRKSRCRDPTADDVIKLKNAETRLSELKSSMMALGKEATTAMMSVEEQQQQITFQKLLTMVNAERSYHQNVVAVLEKLYSKMIVEEELKEELKDAPGKSECQRQDKPVFSPHRDSVSDTDAEADTSKIRVHYVNQDHEPGGSTLNHEHEHKPGGTTLNLSDVQKDDEENPEYSLAKVIHSFDAQEDGELTLAVGDSVVVRQVASNGWSEGECKGKAGWFPSAYVERPDMDTESKLSEDSSIYEGF